MIFSVSDELTMKQIDQILGPPTPQQKAQSWPGEENTSVLNEALKRKEETVLLDGKLFTIRYTDTHAFVKPARGYIPCGWFPC